VKESAAEQLATTTSTANVQPAADEGGTAAAAGAQQGAATAEPAATGSTTSAAADDAPAATGAQDAVAAPTLAEVSTISTCKQHYYYCTSLFRFVSISCNIHVQVTPFTAPTTLHACATETCQHWSHQDIQEMSKC
jgi:hypothetical protein